MLSYNLPPQLQQWPSWPIIAGIGVSSLLGVYWLLLPKIIKGIPYKKSSAWNPLGDLGRLGQFYSSTGEVGLWFSQQCIDLSAPIAQIFLMRTPMVIVGDHRECEDILSRRFKEFDRVDATKEAAGDFIPKATMMMESHDRFRAQRRLWAGTMSTSFLHDVAVPHIRASAEELVQLWRRKAKLANSHPFQADRDIKNAISDITWSFTIGSKTNGVWNQVEKLAEVDNIPLPADLDEPAEMPEGPLSELHQAMLDIIQCLMDIGFKPFAMTRFWFIKRFSKKWKSAVKAERDIIKGLLQQAKVDFEGDSGGHRKPTSAIEQVLGQELKVIERTGAAIGADDDSMHDEIFLFFVAGFETTSTALSWGLKYLSNNTTAQDRLREELRKVFPNDTRELPSSEDIIKADVPYLDACINEILRLAQTAGGVARVAQEDSFILGHRIPKGTLIMCMMKNEAVMHDSMPIDESLRSKTGKHVASRYENWSSDDRHLFNPERWLESNERNEEVVNSHKGPSLPFAAGPRGCFGRKLAMLELRIIIISLVLNFEFQKVPDNLNSYKGKEVTTRMPEQCYVKLTEL